MSYLIITEASSDVRNATSLIQQADDFTKSRSQPDNIATRILGALWDAAVAFRKKLQDIKDGYLKIPEAQRNIFQKIYIKLMNCIERFEAWCRKHTKFPF
jgi:hypothetical protein